MASDLKKTLNSFTNPTTLKKKAIKKRKKEEAKANEDKRYAKNCFNDPPDEKDKKKWQTFLDPFIKKPTTEFLQKELDTILLSDIGFQIPKKDEKTLIGIFTFLEACDHCELWLKEKLRKIGWKCNMTQFHPVSSSFSLEVLLHNTLECYKMACKQRILCL